MQTRHIFVFLTLGMVLVTGSASDTIRIHALHKESYACTEHWAGQFKHLGDALGTDCVINGWYEDDERLFARPYKNDGLKNDDWFGFGKDVLAPCDCTVERVHINPVTNEPGIMTPGRASSITFVTDHGQRVLLAHVQDVAVEEGQAVSRGERVATVGNNGYCRNPHIHIGAWDADKNPLQIQFDQATLGQKTREEMAR